MQAWLDKAGFDTRFASLVLALAAIWLALALATDGLFLSPRNLYNLSIQTCVTAIMACGMVFIIVARQIDLSVGSAMAFAAFIAYGPAASAEPASSAVADHIGTPRPVLGLFQGWVRPGAAPSPSPWPAT
jgi:D-xylose transport system permease protein